MKKRFSQIVSVTLSLALLSGCASYRAAPLNILSSDVIQSSSSIQNPDLFIKAKVFDEQDCNRYLDRNVIAKGYQPIQLYIQNNSDRSYLFLMDSINLPYARSEEVARKVHTSTVGRVLGYGIPGLLMLFPLLVPAVVDGVRSAKANEALDNDFLAKVARNQTINPHSQLNKIIFVPVSDFQQTFSLTLIDLDSKEPKTFFIAAT